MSVQTPPGPGPGHYPTAPPWAPQPPPEPTAEPAAALYGGLVAPYGDPENKHGQLLVRFPGEVHAAGRPEAPSWRPVVLLTFFFGLLGAIPAFRRARKAKRYGRQRAPYWIAFAATLVAASGFWFFLTASVLLPAYLDIREEAVTKVVQGDILQDGRIERELAADVTDGKCMATGERGTDGLRTYLCTFKTADGSRQPLFVRADEQGHWELQKSK